jgi:hypothetical protein
MTYAVFPSVYDIRITLYMCGIAVLAAKRARFWRRCETCCRTQQSPCHSTRLRKHMMRLASMWWCCSSIAMELTRRGSRRYHTIDSLTTRHGIEQHDFRTTSNVPLTRRPSSNMSQPSNNNVTARPCFCLPASFVPRQPTTNPTVIHRRSSTTTGGKQLINTARQCTTPAIVNNIPTSY